MVDGDSDCSVNADLDSLDVDSSTVLKPKDESSGLFVKSIGEYDESDMNSSLEDGDPDVVSVPDNLELLSVSVDDDLNLGVEVFFKSLFINLEESAESDSDVSHSLFSVGLDSDDISVVSLLVVDVDSSNHEFKPFSFSD